jgi:hypothetical protein
LIYIGYEVRSQNKPGKYRKEPGVADKATIKKHTTSMWMGPSGRTLEARVEVTATQKPDRITLKVVSSHTVDDLTKWEWIQRKKARDELRDAASTALAGVLHECRKQWPETEVPECQMVLVEDGKQEMTVVLTE